MKKQNWPSQPIIIHHPIHDLQTIDCKNRDERKTHSHRSTHPQTDSSLPINHTAAMASNSSTSYRLSLLLLCSILLFGAATSESVVFIDSPNQSFLRSSSHDAQTELLSVPDVAAAVSILLGFPPSHSVSASSASKLNDILAPSPFDRPRAVLLLEVTGVPKHLFQSRFTASLNRDINLAGSSASIRLPSRDEAPVVHLDEPLSNNVWTDQHVTDFAQSIGGSYANAEEPLNGELVVPLDNGAELKLQMSKVADREFAISLLTFVHNVKRAIKSHLEASRDGRSLAELLKGSFDCLKGLREEHIAEGVVNQRAELFVSASMKMIDLLLDTYSSQLVGVVLLNKEPSAKLDSLFEVTYMSRSSRELAENESTAGPIIIARVLLVRTTLAWMTGIILIIATLLGIYFLMNMPLTRDTLLYSNVKLD